MDSFIDRFNYLRLDGEIGAETFGFDRYLNQALYRSKEWKNFRNGIILRDNACDLAHSDHELHGMILIHHINPITIEDIEKRNPCIFDPENVVCTGRITHNAIHYGDDGLLVKAPIERSKNDTCPWKQ